MKLVAAAIIASAAAAISLRDTDNTVSVSTEVTIKTNSEWPNSCDNKWYDEECAEMMEWRHLCKDEIDQVDARGWLYINQDGEYEFITDEMFLVTDERFESCW